MSATLIFIVIIIIIIILRGEQKLKITIVK